jgi:hypothetical protein
MYDFDVYGAMPTGRLPPVQDGSEVDVRAPLEEAATLFPARADFRWYATGGREGRPPAATSYAFPYAGYYVMRSGWDPDARWLWFDGGPFGYGHQHEDKLQIILAAYGRTFLVDPGNFTYDASRWRSHFVDSPSHNVVLVDGAPQRRRGRPRPEYAITEPARAIWIAGPAFDYVEATFDDPFGRDVDRAVRHTRAVVFIKPDVWVMLDRLEALDGRPHTYEALFHADLPVAADGLRLRIGRAGDPMLTIAARADAGLTLRRVEGQEDPLLGWLPDAGATPRPAPTSARPAPVGVYATRGGTSHLFYVMAPAPAGAPDPVRSIDALGNDPAAARITLANGRVYDVRFPLGRAAEYVAR